MPTREDVVKIARSFKDARFRQCGRLPHAMDCVGLIVLTGRELGLEIEDASTYTFDPKPKFFMEHVRKQSVKADRKRLRHGQICLFRQSVFPMHLGILTMDGPTPTVINANLIKRKVVEQPYSEWRDLLIEVRDYKGIV